MGKRWPSQITHSEPGPCACTSSSLLLPSGLPPVGRPADRLVVVCWPAPGLMPLWVHTDQGCRTRSLEPGSGGSPGMPISGPRGNWSSDAWLTVCWVTESLASASLADA